MSVVIKFPRRLTVVGYCWHPFCGEVLYREVPHDDVEGLCNECSLEVDRVIAHPFPLLAEFEVRRIMRGRVQSTLKI
jgi:hypothetical protein